MEWLRERASVLSQTLIACLVIFAERRKSRSGVVTSCHYFHSVMYFAGTRAQEE